MRPSRTAAKGPPTVPATRRKVDDPNAAAPVTDETRDRRDALSLVRFLLDRVDSEAALRDAIARLDHLRAGPRPGLRAGRALLGDARPATGRGCRLQAVRSRAAPRRANRRTSRRPITLATRQGQGPGVGGGLAAVGQQSQQAQLAGRPLARTGLVRLPTCPATG
jgi:hypothetical protein